ncbi:glycogen/starch/alpha-glucan phosphorylase [Rhodobium gokarnense]|uniref:Alpha-1,4 glucan phosphorylase n=1 Tax=Rhodobium gokarnense TaxID=364296 RepID=A0ABT3H799_9HYPH|nr:glycogen/starch/alpha-glucan phosphorylase [Rhodobium gokarnense]MCW2306277.1 starch phosphorylase [Rhodobium gokarnense]
MTLSGLEPFESASGAAADLQQRIVDRLIYTVGKDPDRADLGHWNAALSLAVRDHVVDYWHTGMRNRRAHRPKRVYYLSMEFLIGRLLRDAVSNLGMDETCHEAMDRLGVDYEAVIQCEADAALGNGGLGRLAACFLDSMSSLGISAFGYGIRYEHGLFRQRIENGWQMEEAEDWLVSGHVWEFERPEVRHTINFGGHVETDENGRATWRPADRVIATPFDTPIAGWQAANVNTLRLWAANPIKMFDLDKFNRGDYLSAARHAVLAETISRILYPDDTTHEGKELRLKQEYFFTAASLEDILIRHLMFHGDVESLPDHAAIQLNDTHPSIAVPELLRRLVDEHDLPLEKAFDITNRTLCYTNHTLMPEALERWPVDMMRHVLPRHMQLIEWIDHQHRKYLENHRTDVSFGSTKVIDDYGGVRMGNLAFIGSHRVNGVSALHTDLMKKTVFADLHALYPDRIVNQTNGITPRRWLYQCNPGLRDLLIESIGERWVGDLEYIEAALPLADNANFRDRFAEAKLANKVRLAGEIKKRCGISVDPHAMFDVHIKRIHEYKRQLLNILEVIARYNAIKANPNGEWTPRVKIFAGKAAPGYFMAKMIIKLINDVANVVNNDPEIGNLLKVVFMPNYNVSSAEIIIPAADLSEQISTAGMEASGTGNMKFALNGALTVGTLDGANVEICERVGEDNIFIFGLTAEGVADIRKTGFNSNEIVNNTPALAEAVQMIERGDFSPDDRGRFHAVTDKLRYDDYFLVTVDFAAYCEAQRIIDGAFRNADDWTRRSILNTANVGWFSSDRSIRGYARDMWNVPVGS